MYDLTEKEQRAIIMRISLTSLLVVLLGVLLQADAGGEYTGYGYYGEEPDIAPIYIDDAGRISLGERIEVGTTVFGRLSASPRGTHMLAKSMTFHNLKLDKQGQVCSNELIDLDGLASRATFSPDGSYVLLRNVVDVGVAYIHVYRIQDDDNFTSTGNFFDLSQDVSAWDFSVSPLRNTVIATHTDSSYYIVAVLRLTSYGDIIDTGQRISLKPFYADTLRMSAHGKLCANSSLNYVCFLRIAEDGAVSYNGEHIQFDSTGCTPPVFMGDGKFMLIGDYMPRSFADLYSFRILPDGGFEEVHQLSGIHFIAHLALTPDEKYAFTTSYYRNFVGNRQTLSVARVYPDGTLKNMLSDIEVPGCFSSVVFPSPWVLAEYGVEGDELKDFGEWSTGGAPASFQLPAMERSTTGMPELSATPPGPCFGFWQSPADACMIVPRSLYRARFVLSTRQENYAAEEEPFSEPYPYGASSDPLPTLRLRIGTQNQHQAATLSMNAYPDDWLAPTQEGTDYELLIEPPFTLLRQEEDLDDLFLALDLLGFAPDVDTTTSIVLEKAWVDRIPIDALTTAALVCDYSFESDPEGWTSGGARELLSEPVARWTKGALVLEATTNTDCFGFWQNPAGDIVTSTGAELYRATFEVRRSEVADIVHVPVFRVRLNSEDGKLAATLTVGGTACEEEAEWTALKPYALYYLKPQTPEPMRLRLAFDLLNYDPYASPNATLELHHVTFERLELPGLPMDR